MRKSFPFGVCGGEKQEGKSLLHSPCTFGKYKDQPLSALIRDSSYVAWMGQQKQGSAKNLFQTLCAHRLIPSRPQSQPRGSRFLPQENVIHSVRQPSVTVSMLPSPRHWVKKTLPPVRCKPIPPIEKRPVFLNSTPIVSRKRKAGDSEMPSGKSQPSPEIAESSCVLCLAPMMGMRRVAFNPCGHSCVCLQCYESEGSQTAIQDNKKCYICRKKIKSILNIFL